MSMTFNSPRYVEAVISPMATARIGIWVVTMVTKPEGNGGPTGRSTKGIFTTNGDCAMGKNKRESPNNSAI